MYIRVLRRHNTIVSCLTFSRQPSVDPGAVPGGSTICSGRGRPSFPVVPPPAAAVDGPEPGSMREARAEIRFTGWLPQRPQCKCRTQRQRDHGHPHRRVSDGEVTREIARNGRRRVKERAATRYRVPCWHLGLKGVGDEFAGPFLVYAPPIVRHHDPTGAMASRPHEETRHA